MSMPKTVLLAVVGVLAPILGLNFGVPLGRSSAARPAGARPAAAVGRAAAGTVTVRVSGNHLVNGAGQVLTLRGVDRSGMEYACAQGWGLADGPMDQASVDAMASWGIDVVRLPLNEDCWLGINGVSTTLSGTNYRNAVVAYVNELHHDGIAAILDLHWNAPGTQLASGQEDMADADHSPAFWSSVATTFKADHGVIFDLYNEPHDITWQCWDQGCDTPGYQTAGMQSLVDAVRATGATQPVMLGGLGWAGDPDGPAEYGTDPSSGWVQWLPTDPAGQEVLSVHDYNGGCGSAACWTASLGPIVARYPTVFGEFGETDCQTGFDTALMGWADQHAVSYVAWTWDAWDPAGDSCGDDGPSVITDYTGTSTTPGAAIRAHYLAAGGPRPTVATSSVGFGTSRLGALHR